MTETLTLPTDTRAEEIIIGLMVKDSGAMAHAVQVLDADDFSNPEARQAFECIRDMAVDGEPVSKQLLMRRMGDDADEIWTHSVFDCDEDPKHISHFVDAMRQTSKKRKAARKCMEIARHACNGATLQDIIDEFGQAYVSLVTGDKRRSILAFDEAVDQTLQELESIFRKDSKIGVKTQVYTIDRKTGGLWPGDMVVLGARPSVGKTAVASNIAMNAARQGVGVLFFSLEQGQMQIVSRCIGIDSGLAVSRMLQGDMTASDFEHIRETAKHQRNLPIIIGDVAGARMVDLMTGARVAAASLPNLGLIIVDYLQLVRKEGRENDTEHVTRVSAGLKQMARALNVPVLALSQLRRFQSTERNEKGRHARSGEPEPTLSDLRQSGAIEQDADVVILLHRYWSEEGDDDESVKIQFSIAKHRNGPVGKGDQLFELKPMRLQRWTGDVAPPF